MNENTVIHLKKKLNVTDLSGEKVMIDFDSGKYFMIKGSGNAIWDLIQQEITVGEVVECLLKDYDVTPEVCKTSVQDFLGKLQEFDFIELS